MAAATVTVVVDILTAADGGGGPLLLLANLVPWLLERSISRLEEIKNIIIGCDTRGLLRET